MRMPWRRRRSTPAIAPDPEGGADFRDAQRAVTAAARSADRVGVIVPQMASLREQLRAMRDTNHFSERFAEMLRQGYGSPHPHRGP